MKLTFLLTVLVFSSFIGHRDPLTEQERKFASDLLTSTQNNLVDITKGLSDVQLEFRAAPDRWSVEDCVKHIAAAEMALWKMTDSILNTPANPEKRSEIKITDDKVIEMITDRSFKAKTSEPLKPENTPFKSYSEALASFQADRKYLIDFINKTDKDLRGHVVNFPVGVMDTYQMVLFIGAHSKRHTLQIQEVMADPGFPKQ